jgi:hypothetical protein
MNQNKKNCKAFLTPSCPKFINQQELHQEQEEMANLKMKQLDHLQGQK